MNCCSYLPLYSNRQQHQSNDRWVVLKDLALGASGLYTCEASTEAPKFKTVNGNGKMDVIDLPDSKPILRHNSHFGNGGYRLGDVLDVNCTSPMSLPPSQLRWFVNNEMVSIVIKFFWSLKTVLETP